MDPIATFLSEINARLHDYQNHVHPIKSERPARIFPGRPPIGLLLLVTRCPAELLVLVLPDFLPALFDDTGHRLSSFL